MKNQLNTRFAYNSGKNRIHAFLIFMLCLVAQAPSMAQTVSGRIISFDFSNTNGMLTTRGSQFNNATYVDTSAITRSASLAAAKNNTLNGNFIVNNYFAAVGWTGVTESQAVNLNSFVQFPIKPKSGYEYRVDSIFFRWRSSGSGVTNVFIRSSRDNYATTLASAVVTRGSAGLLRLALNNPVVSDSSITFRIYAYGADANQNFAFGENPISVINPDIEARGRMTVATPSGTILAGVNPDTICQGSTMWVKNTFTNGTPPYKMYMHDGSGQQYVITYNNQIDSTQIYPELSWAYTIDSVIDVNGHKSTSNTGSASIQVRQNGILSGLGNYSYSHAISDGAFRTFASAGQCGMWLTINDPMDGIALGNVSSNLQVVSSSFLNSTSRYFLPRKINIAAGQSGQASLKLCYTQAEFDLFNTQTNYHKKMPLNATDSLNNKANIRVARTTGNIETSNLTLIEPQSVIWNASKQYWEVMCNVSGSVLNGDYYITSPFNTSKLVGSISHVATSPSAGATAATVTVDWDDVQGVTQYRFRFRAVGQPNWNVGTITGSTRVLNNLSFNTQYEVQIRVYEGPLQQGEYTPSYTFTTPLEPNKLPACSSPITNAMVTNATTAQISWNSVAYAQNYQIQIRAINTLNWGGTTTNQNSWVFSNLSPNTTYEYRVRTACEAGTTEQAFSDFSTIDTFTTTGLVYCNTPININVVSIDATSVMVNWQSMNYADVYNVQMRVKNNATWGGSSTADSFYTFTGLTPNTTYEYRVRTNCTGGVTANPSSDFSTIQEFTTSSLALGVCLPPSQIIATPSASSITLNWTAATNGALYFVQYKPTTAASWGGGSTTNTQFAFNNLMPNTSYQYRIRTTCSAGTTTNGMSQFSDVGTVSTTALREWHAATNDGVYPNPTNGDITITRTETSAQRYHVVLTDVTGRVLNQSIVDVPNGASSWAYSLNGFNSGLYLLRVFNELDTQMVYRIQKN